MRGVICLAIVLVLGVSGLWLGTDGLAAFTAETARRLDVARNPRPLPDVALEEIGDRVTQLGSFAGKVVLIEFIYTRCPTICTSLGSAFEITRGEIRASGRDEPVVLLTLSFDFDNDGPEQLSEFAGRFGGADAIWYFARTRSQQELEQLMRAAEVIAVPDGTGGFVHNAAIHVVDRRGRLVRILDADAAAEALSLARTLR